MYTREKSMWILEGKLYFINILELFESSAHG